MPLRFLDLIGGAGLAALREAMASGRELYCEAACGIDRDRLLPGEQWEQLLLRGRFHPNQFRVTVNGRPVDLLRFKVTDADGRVRPLALQNLTRQGASIVLGELERHLPHLWDLACDAERVLQERVTMTGIASYSKLPALAPHYDAQDLVIVQLSGSKTWRFLGDNIHCGVRRHPRAPAPKAVTGATTMHPGDLLFVPAGLHHVCEAEGYSLHVGIQIDHASGRDLILHLMDEHPSLNRGVRRFLGPEALAEQASILRSELIAALDELDLPAWLSRWNTARSSVTSLDLGAASDELAADADATVILALTIPPDASAGGDWKAAGVEFRPIAGTAAVIEALTAGPTSLRALLAMEVEGVSGDEIRAAVDQLVKQGVLQVRRGAG